MQRWELFKDISEKTTNLLLLTATPHNGYTDSFASLVEGLNINATNENNINFIDKNKAKKHVCQRTRGDVVKWLKEDNSVYNPFPERDKKEVIIESVSKLEVDIYKQLHQYGTEMLKLIGFSNLQYLAQFTIFHLLKRVLSSPNALRISLKNRINKLKTGFEETEISENDVKSVITESDNLENISTEEASQRIERSTFGKKVSEYEINILEKIYENVNKIKPINDSKYSKLKNNTIPELFNYNSKIIIFTRYKDTLEYLANNLIKDFPDTSIFKIHGDIKSEQRKEIFAQFEKANKSLLIATDCISEGMNLQYLCSQVIHYELPWNPNRLEQRNGRVDRFGQPEKVVHIRTLIVNGTLDEDILEKIIEKADRIKAEFGFSPPFFNDENDILLRLAKSGKTPKTRLKKENEFQLSLFDSLSISNGKTGETEITENEDYKIIEQIKNDSFYGQTEITLPDVERKLRQTEQTIGGREELEKFIISALNLFGCSIQKTNNDVTFNVILSNSKLSLIGKSNRLENVTLDKNYAVRNPGVELIDLSHPLVAQLIQILKQQLHTEPNYYGRTAYKISDSIDKPVAIMKILTRYVVETIPNTLIEDILDMGFYIYDKKILSPHEIKTFEQGKPQIGNRTNKEFKEDMQEIFSNKFWEQDLFKLIEENRLKIIKERENLISALDYKEMPSWLRGITDISYASYDIITITIGYPI